MCFCLCRSKTHTLMANSMAWTLCQSHTGFQSTKSAFCLLSHLCIVDLLLLHIKSRRKTHISHLLTQDTNRAWDALLLSCYAVCDILLKINPTAPDIFSCGWVQGEQPASWCEMFSTSMAACWSNDLIRCWLQSCWLQWMALPEREWEGEREEEGAIESGTVSLSNCQEQRCIALLCLAEVCVSSWVEIQSESAGVDINTYLLAVISTRESDMMLRTKLAPLDWIMAKGKEAAHLNGSLFTNNAIAEKHLTASALSWHCARAP